MNPGLPTVTPVIPSNPWSISVYKIWSFPLEKDVILVKPTPTPLSRRLLFNVSLVIDFCGSFTTTCPIISGKAEEVAASGLDTGLSLFFCGYRFCTGWENLVDVNGAIEGAFEEFKTVRW